MTLAKLYQHFKELFDNATHPTGQTKQMEWKREHSSQKEEQAKNFENTRRNGRKLKWSKKHTSFYNILCPNNIVPP